METSHTPSKDICWPGKSPKELKRESKRKIFQDGTDFDCAVFAGWRDRLEADDARAGGGEERLPAQHCQDMR